MNVFRACTAKKRGIEICECSDSEMQVCMAIVIERYLANLAKLGPDDPFFRATAYFDMTLISAACDSERELMFEITGDGEWLEGDDEAD